MGINPAYENAFVLKMISPLKQEEIAFEENETDFFKFNRKRNFSSSLFSPKHNLTLKCRLKRLKTLFIPGRRIYRFG
jgi:hypothetical protein